MSAGHGPLGTGSRDNANRSWLVCLLLTVTALFIHGYHPYAEDAGIYIPAIKKQLDPSLYPRGSEFFTMPAHLSVFTRAVAGSARILHLDLSYVLLLWYVGGRFFTLVASWKIAELCFAKRSAGFGLIGASLLAATISMPAAGCALLLSDPYVTSRSVSTPLILFSIVHLLNRRYGRSVLCWSAALAFHPLMAVISGPFLMLLKIVCSPKRWLYLSILGVSFVLLLFIAGQLIQVQVTEDYRAAVLTRSYFFLDQWTWYELIGAVAPIALFAWMSWRARSDSESAVFQISLAAATFGLFALVTAAAVTWIPSLFGIARLQPMRALQLVYVLMVLLPIQAVLRATCRNWTPVQSKVAFASIVVLLACGMYLAQRQTFPSSRHIEWPWAESDNPWQQAFAWIRVNTPKDAVFALDPEYTRSADNDGQGFRAQAERIALPDKTKDGGVAALFPQIAPKWRASLLLTAHVNKLDDESLSKLQDAGVSWIVVRHSGVPLDCPYSNGSVFVCRLGLAPRPEGLRSASLARP
jgi:hypothetical protein